MGKTTALAWTWIVKVDTYNPRVRDFSAGHSGVYAFRTFRRGRWEVLYVGESHTDHLWRTSIRHLQDPKGVWARGRHEWVWTPASSLECRYLRTLRRDAVKTQDEWIDRLRPTGRSQWDEVDVDVIMGRAKPTKQDDPIPF